MTTVYTPVDMAGDVLTVAGLAVNADIPGETGLSTSAGFTLGDSVNLVTGTTTGSQIATATTQKLGFYGVTPVVQQAAITTIATNATGTAISVAVNAVINELIALGLIA